MARYKQVDSRIEQFIHDRRAEGMSRDAIIREGKAYGYDITARDVVKTLTGQTPEARASASKDSGQRSESQLIQDSWKRRQAAMGGDARIRGNDDYQKFKSELKQLKDSYADWQKTMNKKDAQSAYKQARLDIYLKYDLIDDDMYDSYI